MKITVFTPTYNRAYAITALYFSLCRQTFSDFEWLIVDDGSRDETAATVAGFISEGKIAIRYILQENGGKHRAINRGVAEARGELFFIVDSDDFLVDTALERIVYHFDSVKNDSDFAGVSGLRVAPSGEKIGGEESWAVLDCNALDFRYKYKSNGDMAEVVRTSVFKEFLFPDIKGEKFCPEAVVWNRLAREYKFRHFYEKIYVCEYLPDGLTAKINKLRVKNPQYAMLCYGELFGMEIPFLQKIKAGINFWRFAFASEKKFLEKINGIGWQSLPCVFFGWGFYLKDKHELKGSFA